MYASRLINEVQGAANATASNENVIYLMGDDFCYMNAYATFDNVERIIDAANKY